jgi:single-strand DNA-binding protein
MRVIAQGRLTQRAYQDREGNQRTAIELEVDELGPSLRYATAQVTRATSNSARPEPEQQAARSNAWQTPGSFGDETPF